MRYQPRFRIQPFESRAGTVLLHTWPLFVMQLFQGQVQGGPTVLQLPADSPDAAPQLGSSVQPSIALQLLQKCQALTSSWAHRCSLHSSVQAKRLADAHGLKCNCAPLPELFQLYLLIR